MTTQQRFLYAVVAVPTDSTAIAFYSQCAKGYSADFTDTYQFLYPTYTGCPPGEMMINPGAQFNYFSANKITWQCAAGSVNDPAQTSCSVYPPTGQNPPSASAGAVSVYTYLNGIPSIPVPNSTAGLPIPKIGGNYPINLTWQSSNPPQGNAFCSTTVETASGVSAGESAYNQKPALNCTALILVYDLAWVKTWADIDYFAPLSEGGAKSAIFLNQTLKGNACNSDGLFYFATGMPYQNGAQVLTLEQQWPTVLASFCALPSPMPCRAGVNVGGSSCSNIMSAANGSVTNYCWNAYRNFLNPPAGIDPLTISAVNTAMVNYCGSFPVVNGTPQAPPECYCITPTAQTSYQVLVQQLEQLEYSLPTQPANSQANPFGPMGCWYTPCTFGQSQTTLVPQNVIINPASCPTVCENIVKIFDTGQQSGQINLAGANIEQTITCCTSGTCTVSPTTCVPACPSGQTCINGKCVAGQGCGSGMADCPAGQQCLNGLCVTPCSTNSDCPKGSICSQGQCQIEPSFWKRYWWLLLIAILLVLFFLFLLYLLFKR